MHRRGILKTAFVAGATALGCGRFVGPAAAQTKHIRLYVEMDVPAGREREMLDTFHNVFVPEAVKHAGYVRVKGATSPPEADERTRRARESTRQCGGTAAPRSDPPSRRAG